MPHTVSTKGFGIPGDFTAGVDDVLAVEVAEFRAATTAMENAVSQDISTQAFSEVLWAASELEEIAEKLRERAATELHRIDDEDADEDS
jgi:hypothetical protein